MSKEDLIKLVKNLVLFRKKLETKITELTTSTMNFSQIEEVIGLIWLLIEEHFILLCLATS